MKGLSIGTLVGEYEIESVIAEGCQGLVYSARCLNDASHVILKESAPESLVEPTRDGDNIQWRQNSKAFLLQQKELSERLAQSNITYSVVPKTHFSCNQTVYQVMPYVAGETLTQHLRRIHFSKQMPQARIIEFAIAIAQALHELHALGFAHGDVKPSNIYLTFNGEIKLIDVAGINDNSIYAFGSEGYRPTLKSTSQHSLSAAQTDVYSFYVLLAMLITGKDLRQELVSELPSFTSHYSMEFIDHIFQVVSSKSLSEKLLEELSASRVLTWLKKVSASNPAPQNYQDAPTFVFAASKKTAAEIDDDTEKYKTEIDTYKVLKTNAASKTKERLMSAKKRSWFQLGKTFVLSMLVICGAVVGIYHSQKGLFSAQNDSSTEGRIVFLENDEPRSALSKRKALEPSSLDLATANEENLPPAPSEKNAPYDLKNLPQQALQVAGLQGSSSRSNSSFQTASQELHQELNQELSQAQLPDGFQSLLESFVEIPEGEFFMGSTNGPANTQPVFKANVAGFQLSSELVEQSLYQACVEAGACHTNVSRLAGSSPVTQMSFVQITQEFLPWLNGLGKWRFRLPSEMELEYALKRQLALSNEDIKAQFCPTCSSTTGATRNLSTLIKTLHKATSEWVASCWQEDFQRLAFGLDHEGKAPHGSEMNSIELCEKIAVKSGSGINNLQQVTARLGLNKRRSSSSIGFRLVLEPITQVVD